MIPQPRPRYLRHIPHQRLPQRAIEIKLRARGRPVHAILVERRRGVTRRGLAGRGARLVRVEELEDAVGVGLAGGGREVLDVDLGGVGGVEEGGF